MCLVSLLLVGQADAHITVLTHTYCGAAVQLQLHMAVRLASEEVRVAVMLNLCATTCMCAAD